MGVSAMSRRSVRVAALVMIVSSANRARGHEPYQTPSGLVSRSLGFAQAALTLASAPACKLDENDDVHASIRFVMRA
jgi:hypothetical protein